MQRLGQTRSGFSRIYLVLVALAGCGDNSTANVGMGGRGGGGGTAVAGSGGSAGRGGTGGTSGSGGSIGSAGRGGSGGGAAGTGGTGGGLAGRGGSGGGTAGTGGTGGSGGVSGTGGRGGSGGTAGTGGATGGTGGATGGTGGTAASCALGGAGGAAGAGGALPDSVTFLPNVTVTTLSGGPTEGAMNGAAGVATFNNPVSVAIEAAGSLVVAEYDGNRLRRVAADGTASALTQQSGFTGPFGLAFAGTTLYAQTDFNPSGVRSVTSGTIWRIDTGTGLATTVAPNLGRPRALGALSDGRLVLGDVFNQRVQVINSSNGNVTDLAGLMGCAGSVTGTGPNARFVRPYGIAVLAGDRIIVADDSAHLLREVTLAGVVTAFAGDGVAGTIDGPRASARFVSPRTLAADASGAVFVSDTGAHRIRRIAADGTVTTVAGDGVAGTMEGAGNVAEFFGQEGIAVSADGRTVYVADGTAGVEPPGPYHRIRKITIAP
jgi:sugar lactone lactonase YvrE